MNTFHLRGVLWLLLLCPPAAVVSAQATEPGPSRGLAGEYRGTIKKTQMTVWAAPVAIPGGGEGTALMLFPAAERKALVARLELVAGDQEALYRRACDDARITEYGYNYNSVFLRIWQSGAALVFVYSGPGERWSLETGRRSATARGGLLINDEYMFFRRREYMVHRVKRNPHTGELTEIGLTQTGFLQNFFDNPKLSLVRTEAPAGVLALIGRYVGAKYAAMEILMGGGSRLPTEPAPVCARKSQRP